MADAAQAVAMPAAASAAHVFVLRLVAELGDGADDDVVNAGQLAQARGGRGVGAIGVGEVLLGQKLIQGLALDDGVGAVLDEVGNDEVSDTFAHIDIGAEHGGGGALYRGIVEIHDGDAGFARCSGLGASGRYGQRSDEGEQNGESRKASFQVHRSTSRKR